MTPWKSTQVGEVTTLVSGGTPSRDDARYWGGQIPWITCKDMKAVRLGDSSERLTEVGLEAGSRLVPAGTVLIVIRGMILARDVPVALATRPVSFNQDIKALLPKPSIDGEFLLYALKSRVRDLQQMTARAAHGTKSLLTSNIANLEISLPPLEEQRQIAVVLSAVQRAIERQERLIALTAEFKKTLMHKLFTEGTRGEPMKQTEIGPVPTSWTITELQEVSEPPQYGFTASSAPTGNAQILRITDIQDAGVNWSTVPHCVCPPDNLEKYRLLSGDVVFARIGATTGKNFLVVDPPKDALFASYLIRVRPKKALSPRFLAYFCQTAPYWRQIAAGKGNNLKGGFNSSLLRRMLIPLPQDTEEQERIGEALAALDRKIDIARRTSVVLNAGFRTLLYQLMTGQIRVNDLDLSALEEAVQDPVRAE